MRNKEIEENKISDRENIRDKYTLKDEQARNSADNLDYKVNTGRCVIGQ